MTTSTLSPSPARRAAPPRVAASGLSPLLVRLTLLLSSLGVLALWWVDTPVPATVTPGSALTSMGELTGMLAGLLICVQILLVARVPWFEHAIGMDHLVAWHRTLGSSVLLLTVTHVLLVVLGGSLVDQQTVWSEFWSTTLVQPDVLSALIGTIALVVVGFSNARLARRHLSYEVWYWLHVSTYVAVFLTFAHQINAGAHFVGSPVNRVLWTLLYLGTASAVLTWRVLLPLTAVFRHRVRVHSVVAETSNVVSIWLRGSHLEELNTRAGQFFLFRFLARGQFWTAHPYSVSLVPQHNQMRITVGALGDHSAAMTGIRPGTMVFLEGPFGRFTTDRAAGRKILLVAGGAGIGPIRALAHDLQDQGRDVVVLHRAPSVHHLPLGHELAAAERIDFVPVLGRRQDLGYDPLSSGSLARLVPDVSQREVFICGSPGLASTVTASLRALGVKSRHIHQEELSMS